MQHRHRFQHHKVQLTDATETYNHALPIAVPGDTKPQNSES